MSLVNSSNTFRNVLITLTLTDCPNECTSFNDWCQYKLHKCFNEKGGNNWTSCKWRREICASVKTWAMNNNERKIEMNWKFPEATNSRLMPWTLGINMHFVIIDYSHQKMWEIVCVNEREKESGLSMNMKNVSIQTTAKKNENHL